MLLGEHASARLRTRSRRNARRAGPGVPGVGRLRDRARDPGRGGILDLAAARQLFNLQQRSTSSSSTVPGGSTPGPSPARSRRRSARRRGPRRRVGVDVRPRRRSSTDSPDSSPASRFSSPRWASRSSCRCRPSNGPRSWRSSGDRMEPRTGRAPRPRRDRPGDAPRLRSRGALLRSCPRRRPLVRGSGTRRRSCRRTSRRLLAEALGVSAIAGSLGSLAPLRSGPSASRRRAPCVPHERRTPQPPRPAPPDIPHDRRGRGRCLLVHALRRLGQGVSRAVSRARRRLRRGRRRPAGRGHVPLELRPPRDAVAQLRGCDPTATVSRLGLGKARIVGAPFFLVFGLDPREALLARTRVVRGAGFAGSRRDAPRRPGRREAPNGGRKARSTSVADGSASSASTGPGTASSTRGA